ncbi:MAG TPA: AarF/UbiB family protein [Longimicrobium sp.]|nr:AarF/UbiB family protein [Longimicrobium sp.]
MRKEAAIPTAPANDGTGGEPPARRPRAGQPEPHLELFGSEPRPASPPDDGPRLNAFPEPPASAASVDETTDEAVRIIRPRDDGVDPAGGIDADASIDRVDAEAPLTFRAGAGESTVEAPEPSSAPAARPPRKRTRRPAAGADERTAEAYVADGIIAPDVSGSTVEAYAPDHAAEPIEAERVVESLSAHPADRDQWTGADAPRRAPDLDATLLEPGAVIRTRETEAATPEPPRATPPPSADAPSVYPPRPAAFVFDPLRPYRGVVRRFFVVYRHVLGLLAGGAAAYVRGLPRERRTGLHSWFPRMTASIVWPFLDRDIRRLPFPQQLRRRLEILGPTYIKLGQIMAIREDLLPRSITRELQNLFDRLPNIPFTQVREIVERSLDRPIEAGFRSFSEAPLGSASIAQAHLAETLEGEPVVVKVIKPGVAEMIESDLTLLGIVGVFLQWVIPRYQPRQIVREFSSYTRKEVDYTFEADNAETFAANFRDIPDVVFPRIHRGLSARDVLTMEFMDGFKPGSPPTETLSDEERERVVDLGAASIIRMLYRDGFFHADLHAGNLMILPGKRVRVAFIDLGMVGRFEERTRRQMLYYFHALVTGDVEGSTRYLVDMATVGKGGDPNGFRRAVADLSRRFVSLASRGEISIAQLILESVGLGGRYRVFFPVEMTLMVKALVTFEGVGRMLDPQLDVAAVSQKHVSKIFQQQFDPRLLMKQLLRGSPELVDLAIRLPQLLSSGFKFADEHLNSPPQNPLSGIKGSILAAACIVGGVLAAIQHASPLLWGGMFVMAVLLSLFGK